MAEPNDATSPALKAVGAVAGVIGDGLSKLADVLLTVGSAVVDWLKRHVFTPENQRWASALTWDLFRSIFGVFRVNRPSMKGLITLLGDEFVGSAVGWSAGLAGGALVGSLFQARGVGNLWGLAGKKDRMLVSPEVFDVIGGVVSFGVGLVTLIVVRHMVSKSVVEFHRLRAQRHQRESVAPEEARSV